MTYLSRRYLPKAIPWLGILFYICLPHDARAANKTCSLSDSYVNSHIDTIINLGSVTGIYDNIIDIPSAPKLLGSRQLRLFDDDTAITCTNTNGDNRVYVSLTTSMPAGYNQGSDPDGRTLILINSNAPGLAYSLEIVCNGGDKEGDCKSHSGDTIPVGANPVTWPSQDGSPWDNGALFGRNYSGDNFYLNVYFWQLPSWQPSPYGTQTVGSHFSVFTVRIGSPDKMHASYGIDLNLQPKVPTCDAQVSVKGNPTAEINLGNDITPQQLSDSSTNNVPFTLVLTNCLAIVDNVFVRMTTTKINTNNSSLLGKQSGSASGVGVKITDDQSNQLLPDGISKLTYPYVGSLNTREINLNAQLVSDGTTVQAGDFQASGTFNLSYD